MSEDFDFDIDDVMDGPQTESKNDGMSFDKMINSVIHDSNEEKTPKETTVLDEETSEENFENRFEKMESMLKKESKAKNSFKTRNDLISSSTSYDFRSEIDSPQTLNQKDLELNITEDIIPRKRLKKSNSSISVTFQRKQERNFLSTESMISQIDELSKLTQRKGKHKKTEEEIKQEKELKEKGIMSHEEMKMDLIGRGIAPEYEPVYKKIPQPKIKKPNFTDINSFVSDPAPKELGMVRCFVLRKRKFGKLDRWPTYLLFHERSNKFLLSARKRKKTKTSSYLISLDEKDLSRDSGNFFGKVRGNFLGTEFHFFDKGENEEIVGDEIEKVRNMLGAVKYEKNVMGTKGPRRVTLIIPKLDKNGRYISFPETSDKPNLLKLYETDEWNDIIILKNNLPKWDDSEGSYILDFKGRVSRTSIKNFQIIDPRKPKTVLMQFGRHSDNKFILDYRYPFSAFQAFSMALTACDSKLATE